MNLFTTGISKKSIELVLETLLSTNVSAGKLAEKFEKELEKIIESFYSSHKYQIGFTVMIKGPICKFIILKAFIFCIIDKLRSAGIKI